MVQYQAIHLSLGAVTERILGEDFALASDSTLYANVTVQWNVSKRGDVREFLGGAVVETQNQKMWIVSDAPVMEEVRVWKRKRVNELRLFLDRNTALNRVGDKLSLTGMQHSEHTLTDKPIRKKK